MEPVDVTTPHRKLRADVSANLRDMLRNHAVDAQGRALRAPAPPEAEAVPAAEPEAAQLEAAQPERLTMRTNPAQGRSASPARPQRAPGATPLERIRAATEDSGIANPFTDPTLQH